MNCNCVYCCCVAANQVKPVTGLKEQPVKNREQRKRSRQAGETEISLKWKKELTCVCEGDSGVIPGSPMLLAGDGLASASAKRKRDTQVMAKLHKRLSSCYQSRAASFLLPDCYVKPERQPTTCQQQQQHCSSTKSQFDQYRTPSIGLHCGTTVMSFLDRRWSQSRSGTHHCCQGLKS